MSGPDKLVTNVTDKQVRILLRLGGSPSGLTGHDKRSALAMSARGITVGLYGVDDAGRVVWALTGLGELMARRLKKRKRYPSRVTVTIYPGDDQGPHRCHRCRGRSLSLPGPCARCCAVIYRAARARGPLSEHGAR